MELPPTLGQHLKAKAKANPAINVGMLRRATGIADHRASSYIIIIIIVMTRAIIDDCTGVVTTIGILGMRA